MISISTLAQVHLDALVQLYNHAEEAYSQYFDPFPFTRMTFQQLLSVAKSDCYFVAMLDRTVAGFYMLRGFDQGYATPAYGVWVAPEYSGMGIARATLDHAVSVCEQRLVSKLMLKVHPKNIRAKRIYEAYGFRQVGIDPRNNNFVYELDVASVSGHHVDSKVV